MLMLGADNDGERATAAGMITGLLKEHGLDWHDVVGSIGQPARVARRRLNLRIAGLTGPG